MEKLTFLEKLIVLYENILDHPLFVLIFFIPIILFFLQKKHGKKVYVVVYFLVIFTLLISFGDIIFKLFDNLMDGLFMFLYFPNFITLFLVVMACSLIALISLLSKNLNKVNRVINYVSFGIVQSLFALILITVRVGKINIYKDNALYTNKDVLTLMQLLIGTFSIQVLSIVIIRLINKATNVLDNKANISSDVKKQISNLSKTKVKPVNIDNNKVGYINVGDKSLTSTPILKPFKFDISKLESISFSDYLFPSKNFSTFEFDGKDVTYYNEISHKKVFNSADVNYNKDFNLVVPGNLYKSFKLSDNNFHYLNEVVNRRKLKPVILDSNKFVYLKLIDKGFKKIFLQNKNAFYLNEVIKKRHFKPINIDSSRIVSLDVPKKSFKILSFDNDLFSYLNENGRKYSNVDIDFSKDVTLDVPSKGFNISSIDLKKDVNLDVLKRPYNKAFLKDKEFGYLNEIKDVKLIKPSKLNDNKNVFLKDEREDFRFGNDILKEKNNSFDYSKANEPLDTSEKPSMYDEMFNSKPKFDYMDNVVSKKSGAIVPLMVFPKVDIKSERCVDNLQIVDIQSVLDVVVKYHLMKRINLKTYDKITVNNLKVCNFKLLYSILNVYKLIRK